jgi:hypothetical protein
MKARRWPLAAWRTVVSNVPSRSGSASRLSPACPAAQLLTHNMLMSPGTHNGFPLRIEVEQMEEVEVEFNADFTSRMVSKVEYKALIDTVASVSGCRAFSPLTPRVAGCLARPGPATHLSPLARSWMSRASCRQRYRRTTRPTRSSCRPCTTC